MTDENTFTSPTFTMTVVLGGGIRGNDFESTSRPRLDLSSQSRFDLISIKRKRSYPTHPIPIPYHPQTPRNRKEEHLSSPIPLLLSAILCCTLSRDFSQCYKDHVICPYHTKQNRLKGETKFHVKKENKKEVKLT